MPAKYTVHPITRYRVVRLDTAETSDGISFVAEADNHEVAVSLAQAAAHTYGGDFVGSIGVQAEADRQVGDDLKAALDDLARIKHALIVVGGCWSASARDRIRSIVGL